MRGILLKTVFFVSFLTGHMASFAQVEENSVFTSNNEAFFKIVGIEQHYEFVSDDLKTSVDPANNRFEFVLDMETLVPVGDPLHEEILNDLFLSEGPATLLLTATLDRATASLENLTRPSSFVLNGVLTLNNESFSLPVEISFVAERNNMFYNMEASFDLDLLDRVYDGRYKEIITGEFVLYANDAFWNSTFER